MVLLEAILRVMPLDRTVPQAIFRAALNNDPALASDFHRQLDATFARLAPGCGVTPLDGSALYPRIRAAHTIVATTEAELFANVILRKGVIGADGREV